MPNREKVISGLQRCRLMNKVNCDKCPYDYNGRGNGKSECTAELAEDVITLLKEQEIVRCRDCKYCNKYDYVCEHPNEWGNEDTRNQRNLDWFCADAEKEDETE